jgi:GT2 family glycosyltransferase/SAM-dependent methyltransferase
MNGNLESAPARQPGVAVVITTFNHAHFLADAIDSVLAQTCPAHEIVVVDDGSADDPAAVVAAYPCVRLVRQTNQGLAAARNTGLAHATADKVTFLDADDRLLPAAIEAGLASFAAAPACGFVYGGHRRISGNGRPSSRDYYVPIGAYPYRDFLKGNPVGMHATVMYDRARLIAIGGFDATLLRCEDYDVYLRMSRALPVVSYPQIVAEYRWHGRNMSGDHREMLNWALRVHDRHAPRASEPSSAADDRRAGREAWRKFYVDQILTDAAGAWARTHSMRAAASGMAAAMRIAPEVTARHAIRAASRRLARLLARRTAAGASAPRGPRRRSRIDWGDLDRAAPISADFGFDRGTPIDRYYIERFLDRHAADIAGRVLELQDDSYSRRFGGSRVTHQDVLNLSDKPGVTIVGDLCDPQTLGAGAYDCLVLTQMLQYVLDVPAAILQMHRALAPGGVALVTVPGISANDRGATGAWCWSFTAHSASCLFSQIFGGENVHVQSHGNVYAAAAFLYGLAVEDVDAARLYGCDPSYPVTVTVRARKAANQ